jgi:hypothetical protein
MIFMEAVSTCETSVTVSMKTIRRNNQADSHLETHLHDNLRSQELFAERHCLTAV